MRRPGEVRKALYRFFFSFHLTDRHSPGTGPGSYRPQIPSKAKPKVSEEAAGAWEGEAKPPLPPVAWCGFVRHVYESLRRQHIEHLMLVPLEGAGADSGGWAVLLRRKTLQSTRLLSPLQTPWVHLLHPEAALMIRDQRSVTLFSSAAATCCRRKANCIFWAAGSSSKALMISS